MRYPGKHKQRTRRRILARAGRLFRRRGYEGVGIDGIMAAASLTRGGFYGYFRSKRDLLAQVVGAEHSPLLAGLRARRASGGRALRRQALELTRGYLAPETRERVARGCVLASLPVDVARADRAARNAYTAQVRELAAELARGLSPATDPDPRALACVALCVGGLVLGRAVSDEALSRALLGACREGVARELGLRRAPSRRAPSGRSGRSAAGARSRRRAGPG